MLRPAKLANLDKQPTSAPSSNWIIPNARVEIARYTVAAAWDNHQAVFTVVVDPFQPVHLRSDILPAARAQLDQNAVRRSMGFLR